MVKHLAVEDRLWLFTHTDINQQGKSGFLQSE